MFKSLTMKVAAFAGVAIAATALPATSANAGQAAAGQTASTQTSAAPAVIRSYGYACFGSQVRRCAWFNVDHTRNRVRAYSRITDAAGGRNYSVATSRVRLQAWNGRSWVNVANSYASDFDGWHATSDTAAGGLVGCRNGGRYLLRSVAYFQWRGNPSGASWVASRGALVRC
jgi:hypothetical protein